MKHCLITYTLIAGKKKDFLDATKTLFDQAEKNEPGLISWSVCEGGAPNSFSHVMSFENERAEQAHTKAPHTQIFTKLIETYYAKPPQYIILAEKQDISPVAPSLHKVGLSEVSIYRSQQDVDTMQGRDEQKNAKTKN